MTEDMAIEQAESALEQVLRAELAQGDREIASARPILRQLVACDDHSLFNDEVIARVRGMVWHLARQMLHEVAQVLANDGPERVEHDAFVDGHSAWLAAALYEDTSFLVPAHTLVIEARLAERLHRRSGIDPVLSPLLQELAASPDADRAALAMQVLAAQARFIQHQRRMEWPLGELSGELFHKAMQALQGSDIASADMLAAAQMRLRQAYHENERRVARITRLVLSLERKALRALEFDHAGLAIFVTALSMACEQDRELAVLALGENQCARFALSLRSAGLGQGEVEKQFVFLHPDIELPPGFETLRADQAARLLGTAAPAGGQ